MYPLFFFWSLYSERVVHCLSQLPSASGRVRVEIQKVGDKGFLIGFHLHIVGACVPCWAWSHCGKVGVGENQDTWNLPLARPPLTSMTKVTCKEAGVLPEKEKDETSSIRSGMLLQALGYSLMGKTEFQPIVVHAQYSKGAQRGNLRTCRRIGRNRSGEEDGASDPGWGCSVSRGLEVEMVWWVSGSKLCQWVKWGKWGRGLTDTSCAFVRNLDSRGNGETLEEGFYT